MAHARAANRKIPTVSPQLLSVVGACPGRALALASGRPAARGGDDVFELEHGITVYPARGDVGRWRAVWQEDGERQQCESVSKEKLAAKLDKVAERLEADAPNMKRPGADLIAHYLDPDRLPVDEQWSRNHAHTQQRLCERFAVPVIAALICRAKVGVAGESALWVDPAEIPSDSDVSGLGAALAAAGGYGDRDELMANTAAYTGLRWGEMAALAVPQVDPATRVITVDRKIIEVAGHLYVEAPKNRKRRKTIYPRLTPGGYPLADRLADRIEQARAEQAAGTNRLGLLFPSPAGKHWWSSNFRRRVLQPAYQAAGWRDENGNGSWTWHSLRHVFCTTALFTWKLDATDVSRMAGHSSYRTTLDMYVTTAGILDRARTATD